MSRVQLLALVVFALALAACGEQAGSQESTPVSLADRLQDGRECYAGKAALELADIMGDWCRQYPNDLDAGWCSDAENVRRQGHEIWNQTCADATLAWGELGWPPAAVAEACSAVRDNHIPHADMLGHSGLLGSLQAWEREYCRLVP